MFGGIDSSAKRGSIGKSVFALWIVIHNVRARFRWHAPACPVENPASFHVELPDLPVSLRGYSYIITKLGPLTFTRKGLLVASTAACLTFIVFQSASLCLATTTPEKLAFALRWFLLPLRHIGVSVSETVLTLLLSLRFVSLVFDEVRNVALGIISRRINWKQLTFMETIDPFFNYFWHIFKNIFSHEEQISQAMIVRGFKGDSGSHKIYFLSESSFGVADVVLLLSLTVLIGAALLSERYLVQYMQVENDNGETPYEDIM